MFALLTSIDVSTLLLSIFTSHENAPWRLFLSRRYQATLSFALASWLHLPCKNQHPASIFMWSFLFAAVTWSRYFAASRRHAISYTIPRIFTSAAYAKCGSSKFWQQPSTSSCAFFILPCLDEMTLILFHEIFVCTDMRTTTQRNLQSSVCNHPQYLVGRLLDFQMISDFLSYKYLPSGTP